MTEAQKLWLEDIIKEHREAANNERLWAKGSTTNKEAKAHEESADEHNEFADMLATLFN